ncbi:unnamed protein product [Cuscuta campestris]|uniref:Uncharacterized protein n=1 Tax=Cuscuta campestris TaxID=132261 RepID=A0A484KEM6_9ASTE|nr:unnamed protein product [Cuscuta campestris]
MNFFFNKLLILSQVFTGALFSRLLLVDRLDHQVEAYFRNFNATILTFFSSGTSLKSKTRSTVSSHSRKSSGSFFSSKVGYSPCSIILSLVSWETCLAKYSTWALRAALEARSSSLDRLLEVFDMMIEMLGEGGMNVGRAEVEGQGVGWIEYDLGKDTGLMGSTTTIALGITLKQLPFMVISRPSSFWNRWAGFWWGYDHGIRWRGYGFVGVLSAGSEGGSGGVLGSLWRGYRHEFRKVLRQGFGVNLESIQGRKKIVCEDFWGRGAKRVFGSLWAVARDGI